MILLTEDQIIQAYPDLETVDQVELIGNGIEKIIFEYCNTMFLPTSVTDEKLDSKSEIRPEGRPIISVQAMSDDNIELVEDTDFFVYPDHIYLEVPSGKRKAINLSYTYGYKEPPEIAKKVAEELLHYYKSDSRFIDGIKREEFFEDYSVEKDGSFDEHKILSKLKSYKQPRLKRTGRVLRVGVI